MYVAAGCELPQTNTANDTLELIKRGDISGMSFAFEDDWEDTENGVSLERTNEVEDGKEVWLRHVKRITGLYDVSIVTYPAYEQTSVTTREQGDSILKQIDDMEAAATKREEERQEQEHEDLDEQSCRFREQQILRRRSQRRRLADQFKNY